MPDPTEQYEARVRSLVNPGNEDDPRRWPPGIDSIEEKYGYRTGFDACREAAAELAREADETIRQLRDALQSGENRLAQ